MFGIITSDSASLRAVRGRRSGVVVSRPYDGGAEVQSDTAQCQHCSYTWQHTPGSGKRRGWCLRCHGFVCGRPCCEARGCVSKEEEMDQMSRGIAWDRVSEANKPIVVAVPAGVPQNRIILG